MNLQEQKAWQKKMYEAVLNDGVNLTQWEDEFIESISGRINSDFVLSEGQEKILDRIYTERVP